MSGKMNWAALSNYKVKPADMELFQTYMNTNFTDLLSGNRSIGIVSGGKITSLSGLTVRISAGVAIMPNGLFVSFPQTDVTLDSADPTNARLDRINMTATVAANTAVIDEANISKTLDFTYNIVIGKSTGTPSGSPVLPAQDPTKLSVGYVQVPATAVALTNNNVFQIPNTSVDFGYQKSSSVMGNSTGYMRYNDYLSQLEISPDNLTWNKVAIQPIQNLSALISNNQVAPADISGMTVDTSKASAFKFRINVIRQTASGYVHCFGTLTALFNTSTNLFDINLEFIGDDSGLTFTAVFVSGTLWQIKYVSDNMAGASYTGNIKFTLQELL